MFGVIACVFVHCRLAECEDDKRSISYQLTTLIEQQSQTLTDVTESRTAAGNSAADFCVCPLVEERPCSCAEIVWQKMITVGNQALEREKRKRTKEIDRIRKQSQQVADHLIKTQIPSAVDAALKKEREIVDAEWREALVKEKQKLEMAVKMAVGEERRLAAEELRLVLENERQSHEDAMAAAIAAERAALLMDCKEQIEAANLLNAATLGDTITRERARSEHVTSIAVSQLSREADSAKAILLAEIEQLKESEAALLSEKEDLMAECRLITLEFEQGIDDLRKDHAEALRQVGTLKCAIVRCHASRV